MDRETQVDPKGNYPPVFDQAEVVLKLQRLAQLSLLSQGCEDVLLLQDVS